MISAASSQANRREPMVFRVEGLDCAEEVAVLKQQLGPLVGGEGALAFDVLQRKLIVSPQTAVEPSDLIAAVNQTGMRAELWSEQATAAEHTFWQRRGRTVLTTLCGVLLNAGWGLQTAAVGLTGDLTWDQQSPLAWATRAMYSAAILCGGWHVAPKAWYALLRLRPDMNLLMVIAVLGAVAIGEWLEAATVTFLFAVSLALEAWSVGRARRAVAALMDLSPPTVRVLRSEGAEETVRPDEVPVGALFLVKPGERIALDGRVKQGVSEVNQAPITGESVPVTKEPGADVFAGTINGDGALTVESTKPAGDTTLARIIRLVDEAQSRRSPSEQWVERFARVYTPTVFAAAVALMVLPPLLLGGAWFDWFYRSLVLLVIACPCALVISTPVSIVAGLAAAARNGVLVKGGVYLEVPARLNAIALDKTGTLTAGKPQVVEVVPLDGHTEVELLERAAGLESQSTHPLARAVVEHAQSQGMIIRPAREFEIIQGKGAVGRWDDRLFWLGSHRYLEERGQETPQIHDRLEALSSSGRSIVVIGNESHVCGFIALADTVRPGTKTAIEALRKQGIEHLVMLTGDNRGTAEAIGRETGVDEVLAELLPADKVSRVEELVARYGNVAMVGDGVNDAPALGRATLGIAMGAAGTDAAIETADVALMSDELSKLPWLVAHSRRTLRIIQQNIVFSLTVKAVFAVLTLAGFASLWGAIAADTGASLLVVGNGLRLLQSRPA